MYTENTFQGNNRFTKKKKDCICCYTNRFKTLKTTWVFSISLDVCLIEKHDLGHFKNKHKPDIVRANLEVNVEENDYCYAKAVSKGRPNVSSSSGQPDFIFEIEHENYWRIYYFRNRCTTKFKYLGCTLNIE